VVAHAAVVANVRAGHDKGVAAHGGFTGCGGTAIYGRAFAHGGVIAYLAGRILTPEFQVLRFAPYHRSGMDAAPASQTRTGEHRGVGANPALVADDGVGPHEREWFDGRILADAGERIDISKVTYHFLELFGPKDKDYTGLWQIHLREDTDIYLIEWVLLLKSPPGFARGGDNSYFRDDF
jgi:hypothetical protein